MSATHKCLRPVRASSEMLPCVCVTQQRLRNERESHIRCGMHGEELTLKPGTPLR